MCPPTLRWRKVVVPRGSAEIVVVSIIVQSSLDPTLCVRDPHSPHRGVKPFSTDGQLAMMVRVLDTDSESCLDRVPIFLSFFSSPSGIVPTLSELDYCAHTAMGGWLTHSASTSLMKSPSFVFSSRYFILGGHRDCKLSSPRVRAE